MVVTLRIFDSKEIQIPKVSRKDYGHCSLGYRRYLMTVNAENQLAVPFKGRIERKMRGETAERCSLLVRKCSVHKTRCSEEFGDWVHVWSTMLNRSWSIHFQFPSLEKCLKGRKVSNDSDVTAETEQYFSDQILVFICRSTEENLKKVTLFLVRSLTLQHPVIFLLLNLLK